MNQELLEILKRSTPDEARTQLNLSARDLDTQVFQLTASLNGPVDSPERQALVAYVTARIHEPLREAGERVPPLNLTPELEGLRQWVCCHYRALQQQYHTPELLEWARRTFTEEDALAGLREIEATGGLQFEDFIHDLEQEAKNGE